MAAGSKPMERVRGLLAPIDNFRARMGQGGGAAEGVVEEGDEDEDEEDDDAPAGGGAS